MSPRKAVPPEQSEARGRLLAEASRLFTEKGFDAVTTREICAAAQLNPGAIHYHFGGKEALYREVVSAPMLMLNQQLAGFDAPALSLHESIRRFLAPFVSADISCGTALFMREMQQPSAIFMDVVARDAMPYFDAFARLLARHAGLAEPDGVFTQLAGGLQAMAHDYAISRPMFEALYPALLADDPQLNKTLDRLADWGCALVAYEKERRS